MPDKPIHADGYRPQAVAMVRATCLYVATKLGDLMIVGGLVPSLLIDQGALPPDAPLHVGTMDLDVVLTLALLEEGRYHTLTERLRSAGFSQDVNDAGQPTHQRWKIEREGKVTVDFLIPPSLPEDRGGRLHHLEPDLAAIIAPGLHLAFRDRERIELSGRTIAGEPATRAIWACGAGAYVILKALAFHLRGENKDAYDLYYVVRNYGAEVEDTTTRLRMLLDDPDARQAIAILRRDFLDPEAIGPRRVAEFLAKGPDADIQADVAGFIRELCRQLPP